MPARSTRTTVAIMAAVVALVGIAVAVGTRAGAAAAVASEHRIEVAPGVVLDATLWVPGGVAAAAPAPAVLVAHGFGGSKVSVAEDARALAERGWVVLAWSSRGFGASGGRIGLQAPDGEVADVSALVDWLAVRPEVLLDRPGDPRVGMTGASYGGGATLLAGAAEPRLDALVAVSAWHSLVSSLAPNAAEADTAGVLKLGWTSALFTAGSTPGGPGALAGDAPAGAGEPAIAGTGPTPCGPFEPELCQAYAASAERGRLTDEAAALLGRADLAGRLDDVAAPTLVVHARGDTLFPLDQSLANARGLAAGGTPTALRWLPGGHGLGATEGNVGRVREATADWFRRWLDRQDVDPGPAFASVAGPAGFDRTSEDLAPTDATTTWALSADGTLVDPTEARDGTRTWVAPPGGVPAALTSLPGLGGLDGLLPPTDLPGQHVAFESGPLESDLDVLGAPSVDLVVDGTGDEVVAYAKVLDVAPDGTVSLPQQAVAPLRVGDLPAATTVTLPTLDHRFAVGHRLRLVLAATDQAFANPVAAGVAGVTVGPTATLSVPTAPPVVVDDRGLVASLVVLGAVAATAAGAAAVRWRRRPADEVQPDPDAAAVEVRGLRKVYPGGLVAVDGVDLRVERGQVFGLLGPNGAGKTTILRMALGLVTPSAGEVVLLGHRLTPGHPVLHHVGALVEGPGFAPYRSGRHNLIDHWRAGGRPLAAAHLDRALAVAALGDAIERPVGTYSHGMRQRLGIAQALLGDPPLLVLDEPTDGLDPGQIRGMRDLLAGLATEGRTVLVSSHLLAEVEQVCTHAAVLLDGRVVAAGPVAEIAGETRTVEIRADDLAVAEQALVDLVGRAGVRRQGSGLVVDLDGHATTALVGHLVRAGVGVQAVAPRGRLEDAFLRLVGGDPAITPDRPTGAPRGVGAAGRRAP